MSNLTIKDLDERLSQLEAITQYNEKDYVDLGGITNKENFCQFLYDFVVDLKSYFRTLEDNIDKQHVGEEEVNDLNQFLEDLNNYFISFYFLGKKPQVLVDTIFLLFGITAYYKASFRIKTKTIELFYTAQKFEELEKLIYNTMYDSLTGFNR